MTRPTDFHESLRNLLAFSSKDWGATREDAWIYGIVFGWDTEPEDLVDDEASDAAMVELAAKHGWDDGEVTRLRGLHAQFVAAAPYSIESRPAGPQTWERRLGSTAVAATRMHLDVDDQGRVHVHEALLAQLLLDAGWERTS